MTPRIYLPDQLLRKPYPSNKLYWRALGSNVFGQNGTQSLVNILILHLSFLRERSVLIASDSQLQFPSSPLYCNPPKFLGWHCKHQNQSPLQNLQCPLSSPVSRPRRWCWEYLILPTSTIHVPTSRRLGFIAENGNLAYQHLQGRSPLVPTSPRSYRVSTYHNFLTKGWIRNSSNTWGRGLVGSVRVWML